MFETLGITLDICSKGRLPNRRGDCLGQVQQPTK